MENYSFVPIPEEEIPAHFVDGKPYVIVDGERHPYWEGQVLFQEKKVKLAQDKLEYLKLKAKQEANEK